MKIKKKMLKRMSDEEKIKMKMLKRMSDEEKIKMKIKRSRYQQKNHEQVSVVNGTLVCE